MLSWVLLGEARSMQLRLIMYWELIRSAMPLVFWELFSFGGFWSFCRPKWVQCWDRKLNNYQRKLSDKSSSFFCCHICQWEHSMDAVEVDLSSCLFRSRWRVYKYLGYFHESYWPCLAQSQCSCWLKNYLWGSRRQPNRLWYLFWPVVPGGCDWLWGSSCCWPVLGWQDHYSCLYIWVLHRVGWKLEQYCSGHQGKYNQSGIRFIGLGAALWSNSKWP